MDFVDHLGDIRGGSVASVLPDIRFERESEYEGLTEVVVFLVMWWRCFRLDGLGDIGGERFGEVVGQLTRFSVLLSLFS